MKKQFQFTACQLFFLSLVFVIVSCKKKEGSKETSPATSTNTTSSTKNKIITAKVNGQNWSSSEYGWSMAKMGNLYSFNAQTSFNNPFSSISVSTSYTTGVINLTGTWPFEIRYTTEQGVKYSSISGTLNIIEFDTTGSSIAKKFKGSFSFLTDTINGVSYTITDGNIDF
jgi:hypothetical protein